MIMCEMVNGLPVRLSTLFNSRHYLLALSELVLSAISETEIGMPASVSVCVEKNFDAS